MSRTRACTVGPVAGISATAPSPHGSDADVDRAHEGRGTAQRPDGGRRAHHGHDVDHQQRRQGRGQRVQPSGGERRATRDEPCHGSAPGTPARRERVPITARQMARRCPSRRCRERRTDRHRTDASAGSGRTLRGRRSALAGSGVERSRRTPATYRDDRNGEGERGSSVGAQRRTVGEGRPRPAARPLRHQNRMSDRSVERPIGLTRATSSSAGRGSHSRQCAHARQRSRTATRRSHSCSAVVPRGSGAGSCSRCSAPGRRRSRGYGEPSVPAVESRSD